MTTTTTLDVSTKMCNGAALVHVSFKSSELSPSECARRLSAEMKQVEHTLTRMFTEEVAV